MDATSKFSPAPFGLLEVEGPDRQDFLHRLLSQDMRRPPGSAAGAYLLNVQGRPVGQFWAFESQNSTWLVCPQLQAEKSLEELERMHFVEKLRLHNRSQEWQPTLILGRQRQLWLKEKLGSCPESRWSFREDPEGRWKLCRFPWLSGGSDLLWTSPSNDLAADLPGIAPEELERQRILAGRPWPEDWLEKTMFLEIAEDTDYVDGKGCYPGQEVVARTLHRGHINRRIVPVKVHSKEASPGPLLRDDREVGRLVRLVTLPQEEALLGLAYVRREILEAPVEISLAGGVSVTLLEPSRED